MSKHQPYKNLDTFLITERSLNYILRPVQVKKENYPYTYHVENLGEDIAVTVDRAWTYANHLILDFIGHESYEKAYRKIVEKRNTWKNDSSLALLNSVAALKEQQHANLTPELEPYADWFEKYIQAKKKEQELVNKGEYGDELNEVKNQIYHLRQEIDCWSLEKFDKILMIRANGTGFFAIEINLRNFAKRYNLFFSKNRRIEYIKELIKRTADVKLSLDYPLQHPVYKTYQYKGETKTKIIDTILETVRVENCSIFNSNKIENGNLLIEFNTFLGKLYTHNLLTLNTDWFEEDYLKLDGYASAIYRRFFVTRSGNKFDQLPIKELVDYFGLLKNSRYPTDIKRAFEEIKNAGLIEGYKFIVNGGRFSKGYIEVVKSSKSIQDKSK